MELVKHVFLEGADGSGKTTLYQKLIDMGFRAGYHSGGPPKDAEELLERFEMPLGLTPCVIDRYAPISEIVYKTALEERFVIPSPIIHAWIGYCTPVIIYCRPSDRVIGHSDVVEKPHKSIEHVRKVQKHRTRIIQTYDNVMTNLDPIIIKFKYDWKLDPTAEILLSQLKDAGICVD